jgi:hypothetical protein
MNMNQIINMFVRVVMRKIMSRNIDAGINMATRRRRGGGVEEDMTPEEQKRARMDRKSARQARQAARTARRMGRM